MVTLALLVSGLLGMSLKRVHTCSENKQEVFPGDMFELNYILYFTSYVNLTEKPTAAPVFSSLSSGTSGFLGGSVVCVNTLVVTLGVLLWDDSGRTA